jgi:2-dehydropantoate 2-reductase
MNNNINNQRAITPILIGNGRLHKHFCNYLNQIGTPFKTWNRKQSKAELLELINSSPIDTPIWLLVSDSAITEISDFLFSQTNHKNIIHCSGAQEISGVVSFHPLMTFGPELYDLDFYKSIHFVTTQDKKLFDFLPGAENKTHLIEEKDKALYHALCVLSGNMTSLLVSETRTQFKKLGLPISIADTFIQKSLNNVIELGPTSVTGPLSRKDESTVQKNLTALENTNLAPIYHSFIQSFWPEFFKASAFPDNQKGINT